MADRIEGSTVTWAALAAALAASHSSSVACPCTNRSTTSTYVLSSSVRRSHAFRYRAILNNRSFRPLARPPRSFTIGPGYLQANHSDSSKTHPLTAYRVCNPPTDLEVLPLPSVTHPPTQGRPVWTGPRRSVPRVLGQGHFLGRLKATKVSTFGAEVLTI